MVTKPGKVAICLSGLLRTGISAKKSFDKFFGHLDYDLFCHTWTTDYDESFVDLYKPTQYIVQKPYPKWSKGSFGDMLYSIMMANRLKKEYELANDFRYSVVIKSRFDLVFPENIMFNHVNNTPRTIYCSGGSEGIVYTDYESHGINDVLFWGDSQSMDIACDTYSYYKHVALRDNQIMLTGYKCDPQNIYYSPGNMIFDLGVKNNIHFVKYNNYGETPWRSDVGHLDPLKDYDLIRERYCRL